MNRVTALWILALVCGVIVKADVQSRSKHFEMVYSWSGLDYVFPDEATRNKMISDKTFIPGNSVPLGMDVDPVSGRMFLAMLKIKSGIPVSLATVSATKDQTGAHLLQPYPDWSWHTIGCDGITSVEKFIIDECGRLWVVDSGAVYTEGTNGDFKLVCPAQILVFDLKTNLLIRKHKFNETMVKAESAFSTIVVDVISTEDECKDSYAYVADSGEYGLMVYSFKSDDSWRVTANEMYPYPEFGRFNINGIEFDYMYGIYGLALTPKASSQDRILYFNSMASAKESSVATSFLRNKTNFDKGFNHVSRQFFTFPEHRPGGQSGGGVMDANGIMFYNSLHNSSIYCWNHKTVFRDDMFVEVDRDEEAFQMLSALRVVNNMEGVPEMYILSSSFHKYLFGTPEPNEIHFRVMKAPVHKLVEGTICAAN